MLIKEMDCNIHQHSQCSCHRKAQPASQSLEEVDFLKSACSAAQKGDTARLKHLVAKRPSLVDEDGAGGEHSWSFVGHVHHASQPG